MKTRTVDNFIKYKSLIHELVRRDLKVKYRRSFLGYLWSLLNPLLMMSVQAFVFKYLFKSSVPNFTVYLICGNVLFSFFSESTNVGMQSVIDNSSLIKKVYVPKYIFPISRVTTSFVTTMFSLLAIIIVMFFSRSKFYLTALLFPIPLLLLFVFCVGVSLVLSACVVYFRDIQHLYGVFTMALMYATPVFWPADSLPDRFFRIVQINPLFHYITMFRAVVMYGMLPQKKSLLLGSLWAFGMFAFGLLVFKKLQKNFILHI